MLLIIPYAKRLIPDAINPPKPIWQHTEPFKKDWAYARSLAHKVFDLLRSITTDVDGQGDVLGNMLADQELELLGWSQQIGKNAFLQDLKVREKWLEEPAFQSQSQNMSDMYSVLENSLADVLLELSLCPHCISADMGQEMS